MTLSLSDLECHSVQSETEGDDDDDDDDAIYDENNDQYYKNQTYVDGDDVIRKTKEDKDNERKADSGGHDSKTKNENDEDGDNNDGSDKVPSSGVDSYNAKITIVWTDYYFKANRPEVSLK